MIIAPLCHFNCLKFGAVFWVKKDLDNCQILAIGCNYIFEIEVSKWLVGRQLSEKLSAQGESIE